MASLKKGDVTMRTRSSNFLPPTQQRGVSLIELMVGITIGMLVVLAATGTIVLNRVSSTTISDTASVAQQASLVMRQIGFAVRQAGAFEPVPADPTAAPASQVFHLAALGTPAPNVLSGIDGPSGAADEFTAWFTNRGNAVTRDCLGNAAAVGANIPNRFFLVGTDLRCEGVAGNPPQPIARNVEDFQVRYLTQAGAGWIWQTATQVAAAGAWNNVVALEVCVQLRGDVNHGAALVGNYTNCAGVITPQSNFYRVALRQVFQLRNRMNNL